LTKNFRVTVVGSGYVGMSLGVMLAQQNKVTILDINEERVKMVNNRKSTVYDPEITNFLNTKKLNITATTTREKAYKDADFIIVATPTDYNEDSNFFDTSAVDSVVNDALSFNKNSLIIIKSTLPIGHTNKLNNRFNTNKIIFSPEFLREGQALKDNLYPERIIIGAEEKLAKDFAGLLCDCSEKKDISIQYVNSDEAESIKLFANTYLAMRVAFFNELDSFALAKNLNSKNIIEGVCLDSRIGDSYNNPSFGYGGYCLPKDTKQILASYKNIPQALIESIVLSNKVRKNFLAQTIIKIQPSVVGVYRLVMKKDSDNFRYSAVQDILEILTKEKIQVVIYEPDLVHENFLNSKVIKSLKEFKKISNIIISNRIDEELNDVLDKVFTRDIFGNN